MNKLRLENINQHAPIHPQDLLMVPLTSADITEVDICEMASGSAEVM